MKVATTVFVGNISDKASDTLVRQILLVGSTCYIVCICCSLKTSVYVYALHLCGVFVCVYVFVLISGVELLTDGREFKMPLESCKVDSIQKI